MGHKKASDAAVGAGSLGSSGRPTFAGLPGCVATGRTKVEVRKNMREAMRFHLDGMREDEQRIPVPTTTAEYVGFE